MHRADSGGFSLIELIIVMAIIAVMTSLAFFDFNSFASHSSVRTRIAELSEYIWYAQERSSAGEVLDSSAPVPSKGFQVIRIEVREGKLKTFYLEKAAGAFQSFSAGSVFESAKNNPVSETLSSPTLQSNEMYYLDACFITAGSTPTYTRTKLVLSGDTACTSSSMLCEEPDPTLPGYSADRTARNNFDIHLSIEQPTREVHANLLPVRSGAYVYGSVEPNRNNRRDKRISDSYAGIRIVFITQEGVKRSIDVYRSGLVSLKSSDTNDGC